MKALGIDIGSLTSKVVIIEDSKIVNSSIVNSSDEAELSAQEAVRIATGQDKFPIDGFYIVTTGAGGKSISFAKQSKTITTCLARGIYYLYPQTRTVIDIGAESSTVFKLNDRGKIKDWVNHDKCASGTGVFLRQMSKLMQISLDEMSELSLQTKSYPDITSTCAVFAESDVISHVHRDPPTPMADIAAGIYASIVSRIMALCKRVGIEKEVAVTGGVSRNKGLINIIEQSIGFKVIVPDNPQTVAALGAALIASENIVKGIS